MKKLLIIFLFIIFYQKSIAVSKDLYLIACSISNDIFMEEKHLKPATMYRININEGTIIQEMLIDTSYVPWLEIYPDKGWLIMATSENGKWQGVFKCIDLKNPTKINRFFVPIEYLESHDIYDKFILIINNNPILALEFSGNGRWDKVEEKYIPGNDFLLGVDLKTFEAAKIDISMWKYRIDKTSIYKYKNKVYFGGMMPHGVEVIIPDERLSNYLENSNGKLSETKPYRYHSTDKFAYISEYSDSDITNYYFYDKVTKNIRIQKFTSGKVKTFGSWITVKEKIYRNGHTFSTGKVYLYNVQTDKLLTLERHRMIEILAIDNNELYFNEGMNLYSAQLTDDGVKNIKLIISNKMLGVVYWGWVE